MSASVHVLPGDHRFEVGPHDSILDGALRAGLAVNYGCSGGNCGLCRARLVSGRLKPLRHHDFVLGEAEQAEGWFLTCACGAETDVTIEAEEARGAADIPVQEIRTKVRRIEQPSPEVRILRLQTPRTQRLRFLAGQYATLTLSDGQGIDAAIASCPCDDLHVEFHIGRRDDPFVSAVFAGLKPGDHIQLEGPKGDFLLDEDDDRPLLLAAFETGFAAIKSLVEHATALDESRPVRLLWLSCRPGGRYLANLCRSWADALDDLAYLPVDLPPSLRREDLADHLAGALGPLGADLPRHDAFVCANEPLRSSLAVALQRLGLSHEHIRTEPIREAPALSCDGLRPADDATPAT